MKVLDVASLKEGIHATLQEIEKIQSQLSGVQRSVRDIIALDQYLKGKTGEAIRSFYKQIHEPFLIYMHQSLTDYAEQLGAIEQEIQAYEPDKSGLIRQDFLDNNIKKGLDRTEDIAGDLVDQVNREIASIGDLVSLPRLDMNELSFVVQKGRKKARGIVDQLHELDHTQTKNLADVEEKLDVMKQYTSEMTRTFDQSGQRTHSFDLASIYYLPTLPTLLKSIYGEPVVEEKKEDNFFMKALKGTGNFIKKTAVTTYDVGVGGGIGLVDVGKDTVVGLYDTVTDPIGTAESLVHSVRNPVETYKYIEQAIADSYERDMVNGDAESRSHWVTYALGTAATSVVGTKGAGALTKTGVATTKTAVQKSVTTVPNMMNTMQSSRLAQLLPYGPHTQLAMPGGVPSSLINGPVLKENLFMQVEKLPGSGGGLKGPVSKAGENVLDVPNVKEAKYVIAERTKGLDLNEHPTKTKQMSSKKMKGFKEEIDNRTITKQDYANYIWNKKFAKRRDKGVKEFWYQEQQRILDNEPFTRDWSQEQIKDILAGKTPKFDGKPIAGHHSYSASKYPHLADKGEVVYPATFQEHFNGWHGGNWRNSIPGEPMIPIKDF